MQTNLPVLIPVTLIEGEPPIDSLQMPDGQLGATVLSLCALLDIDKGRQVARIKRNPTLVQALVLMLVDTKGGPQSTDVLYAWAIPIWASGLQVSRLPKSKQALALILQQKAFIVIEQTFAEVENKTSVPPVFGQSSASRSVWEEGHLFIDHLKERDDETRNKMIVMQRDLQRLAVAAKPVDQTPGISNERLDYIYQRVHQISQHQGYDFNETLQGLAAHFQVKSIHYLSDKDWPAVLQWFESLLEEY